MKALTTLALSAGLAFSATGASHAYEAVAPALVDWQKQLKGLNGVSITCLRTLDRDYALRICNSLIDHAAKALTKSGVAHENRGTFDINKAYPDPQSKFTAPLNLTIHMRATNPNPLGIDVRIHASVTYQGAVESGSSTQPRAGELLMWQHGLTGSGPRRRLERAVIKTAKERMDDFLEIIDEHWEK